jgi:4-hydroxythreonine-4-phosphate dehydrogenase
VGVDPRRIVEASEPRPASGRRIAVFRPPQAAALEEGEAPFGRPTPAAGRAQLAWIDGATDLARQGVACALVTGPVSKHAIYSSGAGRAAKAFRGHTEHLAERLGARNVVMAFWSEALTVSLVTTHLPLRRVPRAITKEAVCIATYYTADLVHRLGVRRPRIAVASLNPHAGEHGLLGDEEQTRIEPGVALARRRLTSARIAAQIEGPLGAETAIRTAHGGAYDAVVAMYHDQATIPMKLLGFGDAVNVTLGLPIVRTSVDHGTGYDRAGTGKADPKGMTLALDLAFRLGASSAR